MTRKIVSMLLLCGLLLTCGCAGNTPQVSTPGAGESPASSGTALPALADGQEDIKPNQAGVYEISTPAGLWFFADHPGEDYVLCTDIDLGGAEWTPVGTETAPFTGSLNGDGHTVSNFTVTAPTADGYAGFIGVNGGAVSGLNLSRMKLELSSGVSLLGGIAARNAGSIADSSVQGVMTAGKTDGGTAYIGGVAGMSTGTIERTRAALDMALTLDGGAAYVGGIVGAANGGSLQEAEAAGRMIITGGGTVEAGLLGGELRDVTLTACRFSGPMNTIGGQLFNNFAGSGNAVYTDCLWRDNANSDELLPQPNYDLRLICEEDMRAQGTIAWTTDRKLTFFCSCGANIHTQIFEPGETYYGLPYNHKHGGLERFLYCFNEDGTLKSWLPDIGFDGFDMYMGNDCSGAIYWAWARVSTSIYLKWTYTMVPGYGSGTIPVGEYDAYSSDEDTTIIVESSTPEVMYEAYADMHMADAIVTYHSGENHAMLCAVNPVVFRDQNGNIDPHASYMVTHEQGFGLYDKKNSSWRVDWKYTFAELLGRFFIPITTQELVDGVSPAAEVTIDNGGTGKAFLSAGVIESNYRIISTSVEILDGAGAQVGSKELFTGVGKWELVNSDTILRTTVKSVNMADFGAFLSTVKLTPGQTYTYNISVLLSTGEKMPVKSFSFVY